MFSFPLPQTHNGTIMPNMTQLPPMNNITENATPASLPSVQSVQSVPESSNSGHSPNIRKRRREGDGARRIVVASFSNETDALEILANAATDDKKEGENAPHEKGAGRKVSFEDRAGARLDDFVLVKQGILDVTRLEVLVRVFFEHHHPALVSRHHDMGYLDDQLMVLAGVSDCPHTQNQRTSRAPLSDGAFPDIGPSRCRVGTSPRPRHEGYSRKDLGHNTSRNRGLYV